jgi:hypothetical protein
MADNVEINIKALVQGLADVRALVTEIKKLPGAGTGVGTLSKEFTAVRNELRAASTELRNVNAEAQRGFRAIASAGQQATKHLHDTNNAGKATKQNLAELSQGAAALGRAVKEALQGNVLASLRSISSALRTTLNFKALTESAVPALDGIGRSLINNEKLITRFSSVLGTAAKNPAGAQSAKLIKDFGIDAEKALVNPQLAVDKFITSLALIPDEAGRATAAASIFGASTANLLPTIEALVANQQAASVAAAELAAAQQAASTAQARVLAANTAAANSQLELNLLQQTGAASAAEITAAQTAAAAAAAEATAARTAETVATEALVVAEEQLATVTSQLAVTEDVATVSTLSLGAAVTIATVGIGAIVAVAGAVIIGAYGIVKSFSDAGSSIHDLGEKTGLTAEELSVLKLAADQSGSSLDEAAGSFQKYLRSVNEANGGNKEAAATMKQLGIDVGKASKDSTSALEQLFTALHKIPPGAQQVDAAMKAAGKSGANLIPIINQVGGDFAKFRAEAEKLGIVLTQSDVDAADKFGDTMTELGAVLGGIKNQVGAQLLPTILELAQSFESFIVDNRQGISDLAGVISVAVKVALGAFYLLGGTIAYLSNLVYGLVTVIIALVTANYELASSVIQAGKALAQFIGGDVAGAVATMNGAVNQTRFAIQGLVDDLNRAKTIVSQPTFTSFFALLNGGSGATPKTFGTPKPAPTGGFKGGGASKKGGGGTSDAKALSDALLALQKAQIDAESALLKDAIKTEQEILKERFEQNLISYQEYYDQLGASQLRDNAAQIDKQRKLIDIEQKQLEQAKKGSERVKAQTELVKLNTDLEILLRNQENITRRTTFEVQKQAKAYNDMMADIKNQLADIEGDQAGAAANKIELQFRDQLEKAQARAAETGDNADVKRIERLKTLLIATERFKLLQTEVNSLITDRDQLETALAQKVEAGAISQQQANEVLKKFEDEQVTGAQELLAAMQHFADKVGDPALKQAVTDIGLQLQKWSLNQTVRDVDVLKNKLDAAKTALDLRNQELDIAVQNGAYTEAQAFEERQKAIASYQDAARGVLDTLQAIATATHNTNLQAYVDRARLDLAGLSANSDDLAISINQGFVGAFEGLFSSIAEGTKGAAQAFADFGRSILKTLSDVLVKIIITKLAMAAFGGAGGGQGGIGGFLSGLLGGDKAVGGHARGGLIKGVGTGTSDSNLRRLSDGEYVVNARATADNYELLNDINSGLNPKRPLNAGSSISPATAMASSMSQNLKIVNVLPNDLLDNYITSADGSRAMLNFIDSNVNAINAKLKQ